MGDYRAELQALIAACEDHYKWMLADKFAALHQAVQRASAALDGSAVPESWHIPRALSDEALRLLSSLPMDEIERRLRMEPAAVEGQPSDQEVAELTDDALYLIRELRDQADDLSPSLELFGLLHNAADLLEQLSAFQPLRPIPVSEGLPEAQP